MGIAMNISDLLCTSIVHVIGTWFVPKGTAFWSAGNEHTCDIQGWSLALFYQYALGFNSALSIVYLLIILYSWNEVDFRKWFMSYSVPHLYLSPCSSCLASDTTSM